MVAPGVSPGFRRQENLEPALPGDRIEFWFHERRLMKRRARIVSTAKRTGKSTHGHVHLPSTSPTKRARYKRAALARP